MIQCWPLWCKCECLCPIRDSMCCRECAHRLRGCPGGHGSGSSSQDHLCRSISPDRGAWGTSGWTCLSFSLNGCLQYTRILRKRSSHSPTKRTKFQETESVDCKHNIYMFSWLLWMLDRSITMFYLIRKNSRRPCRCRLFAICPLGCNWCSAQTNTFEKNTSS